MAVRARIIRKPKKTLIVLRGLPACGKSRTAKNLAGKSGVICEEDQYYYSEVGDDPKAFDYDKRLVKDAEVWVEKIFYDAMDNDVSPIIIDQGNSRASGAKWYVKRAIKRGYKVVIKEADSPWWRCIRELLKDKEKNKEELMQWAKMLELVSRNIHQVSYKKIFHRMMRWENDITVEDILNS